MPVFRGPMQLKQVAIYSLSSKAKRSPAASHVHARRHGHHGHHHLHKKSVEAPKEELKEEKRGEDWVVAEIDGKVVSWINNYFGPTPVAPPAAAATPAVAPVVAPSPTPTPSQAPVAAAVPQPASSKAASSSGSGSGSGSVSGDYERVGYYNADQGVADGIVFLGNYGGQLSGKFDK